VQVGALTTWLTVASAYQTALAIKTAGTLWAWGANSRGTTGLNSATYAFSSLNQVGSLATWYLLACGNYHVVATQTNGTLWAWGFNSSGQLGDSTTVNKSSPNQVGALTTWTAVGATYDSTTALKS